MSKKKLISKQIYKEVYCDTRDCPHKHCLRRITNAPFDELLTVYRYNLDKNGMCEGLMEE